MRELRQMNIAGWSSSVARRAHNPKVVGSNPAPATTSEQALYRLLRFFTKKSELTHAAAPPLSQKVTFASAIWLQAPS